MGPLGFCCGIAAFAQRPDVSALRRFSKELLPKCTHRQTGLVKWSFVAHRLNDPPAIDLFQHRLVLSGRIAGNSIGQGCGARARSGIKHVPWSHKVEFPVIASSGAPLPKKFGSGTRTVWRAQRVGVLRMALHGETMISLIDE